eukprot:6868859-Prymnesium_polylepis.1
MAVFSTADTTLATMASGLVSSTSPSTAVVSAALVSDHGPRATLWSITVAECLLSSDGVPLPGLGPQRA